MVTWELTPYQLNLVNGTLYHQLSGEGVHGLTCASKRNWSLKEKGVV